MKAREADLITDETVLLYSTNKGKVGQDLDLLRKRRGLAEMQVSSGLKLDIVAPIKVKNGLGQVPQSATKA